MKKLIALIAVAVATMGLYAETIHVSHAFLMRKHKDGSVFVIRVKEQDGYHDWYVTSTDKPWLFYGYESNDEIIVDKTTDIAIVEDW